MDIDLSLWKFYKYGISNNIINSVSKEINNFFDLIIKDKQNNVLLKTRRQAAFKQVVDVVESYPEIIDKNLFENPYILINYGAPSKGLIEIINIYKLNSIRQLNSISISDINEQMPRNMKNNIIKIKKAILRYREDEVYKKHILNHIILYNVFKEKKLFLDNETLLRLLSSDIAEFYKLEKSKLLNSLDYLVENEYLIKDYNIYYFPDNIYYQGICLSENIKKNLPNSEIYLEDFLKTSFKDREIFLLRLEGKTLEEIGKIKNVSRERIRQRQENILKKMPTFYEVNRFKDIFQTYEFTKEEFTGIFNEKPQVYELLLLFLKKGKKDSADFILKSHDIPGSKKLMYLKKHKYFLTRFGGIKKINKQEFLEEILFEYKDKLFEIDECFELYNQEAKKYPYLDLKVVNKRSLGAMAERSSYVINTYGSKFRYYDLTPTTDDNMLSEIISSLEDAPYSMIKLFNENQELMKEIDIRDEYELHNFYKKRKELLNSKIKLRRTPEFTVGEISKEYFIRKILIEFSGKSIDECVDYLYIENGFRKNTITSYISTNFRSYLEKNIIQFEEIKISDKIYNELLTNINLPVYMKSDVTKILNELDLELNKIILDKIGYYLVGNVVFKKRLLNVTNAFSSIVLKEDIWRKGQDSISRSAEMGLFLYQMERELKIVTLSDGVYAKTEFLAIRGIEACLLKDYIKSVYDLFPENSYFSLYTLENLKFTHPLIDYGFELIFYERLLATSDLFKRVNRNSSALFKKGKSRIVTIGQFYKDELECYENGVDIYDFRDDLLNKYGIEFEIYDIQYRLQKLGIYYSPVLNKLYMDKNIYLDEVYL